MISAQSRSWAGCLLVLGAVSLGSCSQVGDTCLEEGCPSLRDASAPGLDGSTRADAWSRPDAAAPGSDAQADSPPDASWDAPGDSSADGPVFIFACGPEDAGLQCDCGPGNFSPAPTNDAGQPQNTVPTPDAAAVVAYHSMTEFDALAVGRWRRTAGQGVLTCDQFGLEFTADHRLLPLAAANDGSVQAVSGLERSFSISFDGAGAPNRFLVVPSYQTNPPIFFDEGRAMYFLFAPWPASYVRVP
jgi:hypothetical protein